MYKVNAYGNPFLYACASVSATYFVCKLRMAFLMQYVITWLRTLGPKLFAYVPSLSPSLHWLALVSKQKVCD